MKVGSSSGCSASAAAALSTAATASTAPGLPAAEVAHRRSAAERRRARKPGQAREAAVQHSTTVQGRSALRRAGAGNLVQVIWCRCWEHNKQSCFNLQCSPWICSRATGSLGLAAERLRGVSVLARCNTSRGQTGGRRGQGRGKVRQAGRQAGSVCKGWLPGELPVPARLAAAVTCN